MKKFETFLRKKLDLSEKDDLNLKYFNRFTRNLNYVLEVNGFPKYFIKYDSEGLIKEKKVYSFLERNYLFETILPLFTGENLIVFPFVSDFHDANVKDNLDFILRFHNNSLKLSENRFSEFIDDKLFYNHSIIKFLDRVNRHEDLVKNFWEDIGGLNTFYNRYESINFDKLPKILTHGDIHHKNLQYDKDKKLFLFDFEDCSYDMPSWDLSRPLMDLEKFEIDNYIDKYIKKVNIDNKNLLLLAIERDFVIRVVTESIGRQQRLGVDKARSYLDIYHEKYFDKLNEIIYKKL
ncbi:hypothetical protein C0585_01925 [Candidatus Woesearchaeota archaeon]|nr:MAG: hypothetical protein C0585_01925 [Candidatus Woesearchaeota archaeon]